ncbi:MULTISPECIES: hypothetical protein [unclassified Pseudomonas]|jgi:hypothetical protein|uniref:hypothetical protein n=1 Tax=unclassified Pseudomonas TaxID=196821 RepID=UPI001BAF92CE|nr:MULTISPECIES: hypothetical protein [unclassified Pseudomonas]QUE93596.1 hypothetical protein KBP52_14670 [Pseudomonas sp. SCA2728.1_7]
MKIVVKPDAVTPVSSALLDEISASIAQRGWGEVKSESNSVANSKGDLVSSIIIGLALNVTSNAVYDLIKMLISNAKQAAEARGQTLPEITTEEHEE